MTEPRKASLPHSEKTTIQAGEHHADEKARLEEIDDAILRAQGHEAALERSFSWLGATGLAVRFAHPPSFNACN